MTPTFKQRSGVAGLFVVVTLLLSWSVIPHLLASVIGDGGDPWQTLWRFEEQGSQVATITFWTNFFAGGEPRLINYSTLPWLPLHMIAGEPLAYNLVWLLSFILSGYFMYLLVRHILLVSQLEFEGRHIELAAIASGLYYLLLPYHMAHAMGHFGAMQLQWLPLAILLWLRFTERPTWANTVGLGAVLTIQSWTEHHYMVWLALFFILHSVFWRPPIYRRFSRRAPFLALLGLLVLLFIILPYWPTIRLASSAGSLLDLGVDQTIRFSADVFSYFIPASGHPLWGGLVDQLFRQHFTGNVAEATQYVGIVVLLLIIFFRQTVPPRQYYFWLAVVTVFFLISLGPRLHVLGRVFPIPLPYAAIDSWPVFSSIRAVGRAGAMVGVGMAVLLGWVMATQIRRSWVAAVVILLIGLDFLPEAVPLQAVALSPAYAAVQALPGSRILELPAATNYTVASQALYASRQHGKEVVGSIALERAEASQVLEEIRSLPAVRHLLYVRTGQLRLDRPDFFDQQLPETVADALDWLDVGGIVVHRDSLSALQLAAINNFLTTDVGLASQEFTDVLVYPVPADIRHGGDGVFLARDGRWANVGFDEERGSTFAEIPTEAGITLYNTKDIPQHVHLRFTIAPESHGNMLFISETETTQLLGKGGDVMELDVQVAPHARQNYTFRNQLTQKVIIRDPSLTVGL